MTPKVKLNVEMMVTIPQAIALREMFEHWNYLAEVGASREISYFCDGDGNFNPKCKVTTDEELPKLKLDVLKLAYTEKVKNGDRKYDFDNIAWALHDKNNFA